MYFLFQFIPACICFSSISLLLSFFSFPLSFELSIFLSLSHLFLFYLWWVSHSDTLIFLKKYDHLFSFLFFPFDISEYLFNLFILEKNTKLHLIKIKVSKGLINITLYFIYLLHLWFILFWGAPGTNPIQNLTDNKHFNIHISSTVYSYYFCIYVTCRNKIFQVG